MAEQARDREIERALERARSECQEWLFPLRSALLAVPIGKITESHALAHLGPEEIARLQEFQGPARRAEWIAARILEREARSRLENEGADGRQVVTSVSHAPLSGMPWIIALATEFRFAGPRVGVDWEDPHREITEAVLCKITKADERALGLEPIDVWVIKEACFKADPMNDGKVIWNYRISRLDRSKAEGQTLLPSGSYSRFKLIRTDQFRLAVARSADIEP